MQTSPSPMWTLLVSSAFFFLVRSCHSTGKSASSAVANEGARLRLHYWLHVDTPFKAVVVDCVIHACFVDFGRCFLRGSPEQCFSYRACQHRVDADRPPLSFGKEYQIVKVMLGQFRRTSIPLRVMTRKQNPGPMTVLTTP
eukprot:TRINITY_DN63182_c0_g1_i1.p1 TRINITY_DN63182_c0_g1~~TRINITY_DN63182_c0_g1_i1.p1  ORF type:complete len:155 (+),score=8.50 TRINITY_DN63182_c0_g1_i1:44-466(+)